MFWLLGASFFVLGLILFMSYIMADYYDRKDENEIQKILND